VKRLAGRPEGYSDGTQLIAGRPRAKPDTRAKTPRPKPQAKSVDAERAAWQRHVIDDASRGADGIRLADVNGDGLPDIAAGWEEGGTVRAYLNPGPTCSPRRSARASKAGGWE
jgi:hypothetical protein